MYKQICIILHKLNEQQEQLNLLVALVHTSQATSSVLELPSTSNDFEVTLPLSCETDVNELEEKLLDNENKKKLVSTLVQKIFCL